MKEEKRYAFEIVWKESIYRSPMKIFILTLGTHGDVQPYVALGKGLRAAGHTVTLCTCSRFESFVTDYGLQYGYMDDGFLQLMNDSLVRDAMEDVNNFWSGFKYACKLWRRMAPLQRIVISDAWESAQKADPDLILFHPKALGAASYAEKLGIPAMMAFYLPLYVPSAEIPAPGFPHWKLGGWYNKLTYTLVHRATALMAGRLLREWRTENRLPHPRRIDFLHAASGDPIPVVHGFSPHVVPIPSDWPEFTTATGFWFLDRLESWNPPAGLLHFLESGDPPVYVGFGSISGRNPRRISKIIVDGLRLANARAVLAAGWGGLSVEELPGSMIRIDSAPHDWLFPRMAAVAHHGGAGTTAAGLRAGRPTIVCPFFGDQPFWGQRVHALGAGSEPIPQKKLTAEKFAAAVREVLSNPDIRRNAEALGDRLRREDGVANAVSFIEDWYAKRE